MRAEVWAPDAGAVVLHWRPGDGSGVAAAGSAATEPLSPGSDGWWRGRELPPGSDYAFEVDGRGPFPDPRGAWQPNGVHGFSRVFDAGQFPWTDTGWKGRDARGALLYELHVGAFTPEGTLDAVIGELPRLAAIGVEMIELMPLAPFPGRRGWGYDGVAPYAVHEAYGGPAALQRLVDAAHGHGLAVCLDVVYNHLGPDGNHLGQFGPYFTDAHQTPWGWAVNFDQPGSAEVRRYVVDNALRWMRDFHVDALRLDAVHEMRDDSPRHILAELADAVAGLGEEEGRPLSLIAESDLNDARMVLPTADGGLGMTAQWNDDVHHALHAYLTGERHGYYVDFGSADCLDTVYREVFWHQGGFSPFRGRNWGAPVPPGLDRRRFVVCASNHDQVGNRALGDRPSARLSPAAQATALAFVLLGPFTPMLFMGEEYGETRPFPYFTDHDEPLGRAVTEGRRAEFAAHGWGDLYGGEPAVPDPQSPATLASAVLEPDAPGAAHDAMRSWLAALVAARPAVLAEGAWSRNPAGVEEPRPRVLTLRGPVVVHANLSDSRIELPAGRVLAAFGAVESGDGRVSLASDSVALVENTGIRGDEGRS